MSRNQLTTLPGSISRCCSLTKLYAANNALDSLPPALPPSLEILHAAGNLLVKLPQGLLAALPDLKFLHLADNRLTAFPFTEVSGTQGLRVADLAGNPITAGVAAAELEALQQRLVKPWTFGQPIRQPGLIADGEDVQRGVMG